MAWEWVAPAGTAVVGVTSVIVTFAAARANQRREDRAAARSRAHAVEDALRIERKEMYLRFLSAVAAFEAAAAEVRRAKSDHAQANLSDARDALMYRRIEIALVAGGDVSTLCGKVVTLAVDIATAVRTDPTATPFVDGTVLAQMTKAMARELSLESPAV